MNTLTWADIDFSLIQPGMITGGGQNGEQQTLVSFAEYISVWANTFNHRLQFFNGSSSGIKFNTGDIRQSSVNQDHFKDSYYSMIRLTAKDVLEEDFYDIGVIQDAANFVDYKLPRLDDDDFLQVTGLEEKVVSLLEKCANSDRPPHYEIFTTAILHALYVIFSTYTIRKKDIIVRAAPFGDDLVRLSGDFWNGEGSFFDADSTGEANNEAYLNYSDNFNQKTFAPVNPYAIFNRRVKKQGNTSQTKHDAQYFSDEGYSLVFSYKNSDEEFVDVEHSIYARIFINNRRLMDGSSAGVFIGDFPKVALSDTPIDVNLNNFKSDPEVLADGVKTSYTLSNKYPPKEMLKDSFIDDYDQGYINISEIKAFTPKFAFANANSVGFDFYVEPEQWNL